ncbi:MAG: hypothetical protein MR014_00690 [Oscillospiraceae bacterium]|nr:hypothetical protein [Oscillospiraceae bacterium]
MRGRYIALAFVLAAALMLAAAGCSGGSGVSASAGGEISGVEGGTKPNTDVGALQPEENELREEGLEPEAPQSGASQETSASADAQSAAEPEKETACKSGTTWLKASDGYYFYELEFADGELVAGWLDSDEGKGGWGGDSGYGIENCRFYGMTVEETAKLLESENYIVSIE